MRIKFVLCKIYITFYLSLVRHPQDNFVPTYSDTKKSLKIPKFYSHIFYFAHYIGKTGEMLQMSYMYDIILYGCAAV